MKSVSETVLITGASSGFGLEFARIFAKNGYNLFLISRKENLLHDLASELSAKYSIKIWYLPLDLTVNNLNQEIMDFITKNNIDIDILINNAGNGMRGYFSKLDLEKQQKMIDLNIKTMINLSYLFIPLMLKKRKGKILNVASTAAFTPGPFMTSYFATKSFVLSFSEGLSEELRNTGIQVSVLCPGPSDTGFVKSANVNDAKTFQGNLPTAKSVVAYGYTQLLNGEKIIIPGLPNKLLVFLIRFMPRFIIRWGVGYMQKPS